MTRLSAPQFCGNCDNELAPPSHDDRSWCFGCKKWSFSVKDTLSSVNILKCDDMGCYLERET